MRIAVQTLLACAALTVTPRATFAQANAPATADQTQTDRTGDATAAPAQPNNAPDASGVQQQATPSGQWVYTEQYGWLWMPYGGAYLHAPADSYGDPSMYVYGPTLGWVWVDAPWVWGWGPSPYFGFYGP